MSFDTRLVEVYRAMNAPQAHMMKAALEDAGIESQVDGEVLQGIAPLWAMAPRILVLESDAARAREILLEIEKAAASE